MDKNIVNRKIDGKKDRWMERQMDRIWMDRKIDD